MTTNHPIRPDGCTSIRPPAPGPTYPPVLTPPTTGPGIGTVPPPTQPPTVFDPADPPPGPQRFNIAEAALAAVNAYDANQDGRISTSPGLGSELTRADGATIRSIARLARAADTDHDGVATVDEIAKVMSLYDFGAAAFAGADPTRGDGELTGTERQRFLADFGELPAPMVPPTNLLPVAYHLQLRGAGAPAAEA